MWPPLTTFSEDRRTIPAGLLICKTKDNVLAQYALESSSLPIGISDLSNNRKRYIRVLVTKGLLAMTILDKPNSKKQRYITIPGR